MQFLILFITLILVFTLISLLFWHFKKSFSLIKDINKNQSRKEILESIKSFILIIITAGVISGVVRYFSEN